MYLYYIGSGLATMAGGGSKFQVGTQLEPSHCEKGYWIGYFSSALNEILDRTLDRILDRVLDRSLERVLDP